MMMSLGLMGCGENTPTFSALADSKIFEQSGTEVNVKIDVLWVIDNSGSMQTSQENLTNNFQSFINDFQVQGFDFQIGVTTTEAYREVVSGVNGISDLRDDSGIQIITPATANINDVFLQNALQGTSGSGDERAFSSFTAALGNTNNASFRRDDAFLAIIIVSDEDDFLIREINLLYVAMTRARDNLYISHTGPSSMYLDNIEDYSKKGN